VRFTLKIKEDHAMPGPGEYLPDVTEGIINPDDLPKPKIKNRSRTRKKWPCPHCKRPGTRHDFRQRKLHHLGDPESGRPVDIVLQYSAHYRCKCDKYFHIDMSDIAPPKSDYTNAVIELAVRLVVDDGLPYREASWRLWSARRVLVPFAAIQNWVEAAGKKNIRENRRR